MALGAQSGFSGAGRKTPLCYTASHGNKESYKNSHLIAQEGSGVSDNQTVD